MIILMLLPFELELLEPLELLFEFERERGAAEMQAIGAGALNQAVKAVAIARGFVAPHGVDLICIPAFTDIVIDGEERTAMKLIIEPR